MKILNYEVKIAIEDNCDANELKETIKSLITEDDYLADNFLYGCDVRYLTGRYVDGVKDPPSDNVTDENVEAWFDRADKELN